MSGSVVGGSVRVADEVPPWDRDDGPPAPASRSPHNSFCPPRDGVQAERIRARFKTAAELAREQPPKPDWAVQGLAAIGTITEVVGKAKASGKTTFLAHLVYALVYGLPFLGFPTRRTPVVWLTEERASSFLETLKRAHLETRTDVHILQWHDVKGVPFPTIVAAAVERCQAVKSCLLAVDTISQFAGLRGDCENNAGDALMAIEPLQMAAGKGLAVITNRHERKGGGEVGEAGRGSSAFSGAVDIVLALRRGDGQTRATVRVLRSLSRYAETPESLVIDLTPEGYVALGAEGTVAALEAERALRDRLPRGDEAAATLEALVDGTSISRTAAQSALKSLLRQNEISHVGRGKKGDPYRYFVPIEVSIQTQTTGSDSKQNLLDG